MTRPFKPKFCEQCLDGAPFRQCGKCSVWLCTRCEVDHNCDQRCDPSAEDYQAGGKYSHGFTIP